MNREYDRISKIVEQLCNEFAYAVHQTHARNGGLIGLAAASIALGSVCLEPRTNASERLTVNSMKLLATSKRSFHLF